MNISKECLAGLKDAFAFLDEKQLRDYTYQVFYEASLLKDKRGIGAIKQAQRNVASSPVDVEGGQVNLANNMQKLLLAAYFEDAQSTVKNYKLFKLLTEKLKNGETLRTLVAKRFTNLAENIEGKQRAAQEQISRVFYKDLTTEEIAFIDTNELDVVSGMMDRKVEGAAKNIAEKFNDYAAERNFQLTKNFAIPLEHINKDRFLRAVHDPSKLMGGGSTFDKVKNALTGKKIDVREVKQKWIDYLFKRLDLDKTFGRTRARKGDGSIDESEARRQMGKIYDKIIRGDENVLRNTGVLKDLDLAKRRRRLFFTFKDPVSWLEYNKEYGHGTLHDAIRADMISSGNKIGMAQVFGSKAYTMFEKLRREQVKIEAEKGLKPKGELWWRETANTFKQVGGDSSLIGSPTLAALGANSRSLTSMGSLGAILTQSIPDANGAAAWLSRWDISYGRAFVNQFNAVLTQATDAEKIQIGKMFHIHLNSQMGYMGRFVDTQNMSELVQKVGSKFWKYNGSKAWDNGSKIGAMHTWARSFAEKSGTKFNDLHEFDRKQFAQYGIGEKEWDALRSKTEGNLFTLDNVDRLTLDDLRHIKGDRDISLHDVRSEVYGKVFGIFDSASEHAILSPGAFIKSVMRQGTHSGTWVGEFANAFTQFKGFTFSYVDRQLIGGFKNADTTQAKLYWGLQQFAAILPLSFLSTYMYYLGKGLTFPDFSKLDTNNKVKLATQIMFPSLGVFSGVLDKQNQNSGLLMSILSSPATRLASNLGASVAALATGNPAGSVKSLSRAIQAINPLNNVPGISPYMKMAFGEEPYVLPGQKQLPLPGINNG